MSDHLNTEQRGKYLQPVPAGKGEKFLRKCRIYQLWRFIVLNLFIVNVAKKPPRKSNHGA
ncbi:hypothetical protein CULT_30024 [[Clostridium] ultunense Esp]|nr:hypothetical protein CULT_30024 [[Clostridium] ultunense Esp]